MVPTLTVTARIRSALRVFAFAAGAPGLLRLPCRPMKSALVLIVFLSLTSLRGGDEVSASATAASPPYRLYAGDQLHIGVRGHDDLTVSTRIPADGRMQFPLLGTIEGVTGRTPESIRYELVTRLADGFLVRPEVTVTVAEFAPRQAYVQGAVVRPSAVSLSPFVPMSALQAVSSAGGLMPDANHLGVVVVREEPPGSGKRVALQVPGEDTPEAIAKDIILAPGDLVIAPRLDRVFIFGQVRLPGAINLPSQERLTVAKAISIAGGFDRFAKQEEVQLLRGGQVISTNVKAALEGKAGADQELRPGDTVFVPESRF